MNLCVFLPAKQSTGPSEVQGLELKRIGKNAQGQGIWQAIWTASRLEGENKAQIKAWTQKQEERPPALPIPFASRKKSQQKTSWAWLWINNPKLRQEFASCPSLSRWATAHRHKPEQEDVENIVKARREWRKQKGW